MDFIRRTVSSALSNDVVSDESTRLDSLSPTSVRAMGLFSMKRAATKSKKAQDNSTTSPLSSVHGTATAEASAQTEGGATGGSGAAAQEVMLEIMVALGGFCYGEVWERERKLVAREKLHSPGSIREKALGGLLGKDTFLMGRTPTESHSGTNSRRQSHSERRTTEHSSASRPPSQAGSRASKRKSSIIEFVMGGGKDSRRASAVGAAAEKMFGSPKFRPKTPMTERRRGSRGSVSSRHNASHDLPAKEGASRWPNSVDMLGEAPSASSGGGGTPWDLSSEWRSSPEVQHDDVGGGGVAEGGEGGGALPPPMQGMARVAAAGRGDGELEYGSPNGILKGRSAEVQKGRGGEARQEAKRSFDGRLHGNASLAISGSGSTREVNGGAGISLGLLDVLESPTPSGGGETHGCEHGHGNAGLASAACSLELPEEDIPVPSLAIPAARDAPLALEDDGLPGPSGDENGDSSVLKQPGAERRPLPGRIIKRQFSRRPTLSKTMSIMQRTSTLARAGTLFGGGKDKSEEEEEGRGVEHHYKFGNHLKWGGITCVCIPEVDGAVRDGRLRKDWRAKLDEMAADGAKKTYESGHGFPGSAWAKGECDFHDLATMPDDDDLAADVTVQIAKHMFDVVLGVPLEGEDGECCAVLMLYRVLPAGEKTSDRPNKNWRRFRRLPGVKEVLEAAPRIGLHAFRLTQESRDWREVIQHKEAGTLAGSTDEGDESDGGGETSRWAKAAHFTRKYLSKFKSQRQQPPGGHTWGFAGFTGMGTFLSVALVAAIESWMDSAGVEYNEFFVVVFINSMAALAAMIFSAPTSALVQPRNILGGHVIAIVVAVSLDYAVTVNPWIPMEVGKGLAPALSIFFMAKLGLIHPPACAAAVIYLDGYPEHKNLGWMFILAPVLLDCCVLVIMGVCVNNLSAERAYPLYW